MLKLSNLWRRKPCSWGKRFLPKRYFTSIKLCRACLLRDLLKKTKSEPKGRDSNRDIPKTLDKISSSVSFNLKPAANKISFPFTELACSGLGKAWHPPSHKMNLKENLRREVLLWFAGSFRKSLLLCVGRINTQSWGFRIPEDFSFGPSRFSATALIASI